MSGLQEDKHHIKISSVEFIKIPSAHQKKSQRFMTEQNGSPGNCKKILRFSNLATAVLDDAWLCMLIGFQLRSLETRSH